MWNVIYIHFVPLNGTARDTLTRRPFFRLPRHRFWSAVVFFRNHKLLNRIDILLVEHSLSYHIISLSHKWASRFTVLMTCFSIRHNFGKHDSLAELSLVFPIFVYFLGNIQRLICHFVPGDRFSIQFYSLHIFKSNFIMINKSLTHRKTVLNMLNTGISSFKRITWS